MTDAGSGDAKDGTHPFGIRLRFRTTKGVTTNEKSVSFELDGRTVTLASTDEQPLRESGWFAFKATGFPSADEAGAFGARLKNALQIASIRRVWGVDVGEGKATSAFFKPMLEMLEADGIHARSNIHGLDVYEDKPGTVWTAINAKATISINPSHLFEEITGLFEVVREEEPPSFDAVRLLNEALISQEAPAQLVLALAAVEMLAQGEDWTAAQREALERLALIAEGDNDLTQDERQEIAQSVRRAIHRMGVRQGLKRLLSHLGLEGLWKQWDKLYSKRSGLLHGLAYAPPAQRTEMVMPALMLCAQIVLTALEAHVPGAAKNLEEKLPVPKV